MRSALFAIIALVAVPLAEASAQAVQLSARAGLAVPADSYGFSGGNCGAVSGAYGVDVQTRGWKFVQGSLEHFEGNGMGGDACVLAPSTLVTTSGGFDLNHASRVLIGGGIRTSHRVVAVEAAALGGFISGRRGYPAPNDQGDRHLVPQIGARGSIIVARVLVLSASTEWTRLVREETLIAANTTTRSASWKPMGTMSIGLRLFAK